MRMSLCAKQAGHSPEAIACRPAAAAAFLRLKAVVHTWACHAVHMCEAVTCCPAVPACCRAQASEDGAVFCRQDQQAISPASTLHAISLWLPTAERWSKLPACSLHRMA